MSLNAKKLELVRKILQTNQSSVLDKIEAILKKEAGEDWWEQISEAERSAIEESLAEANRGDLLSHEQVLKEVRAKYKLD